MAPKRKAAIQARKLIRSIAYPESKKKLMNARRVRREMKELEENSDDYRIVFYMEKDMVLIEDAYGRTWSLHRSTDFREPPAISCLSANEFYMIGKCADELRSMWRRHYSSAYWFSFIQSYTS